MFLGRSSRSASISPSSRTIVRRWLSVTAQRWTQWVPKIPIQTIGLDIRRWTTGSLYRHSEAIEDLAIPSASIPP